MSCKCYTYNQGWEEDYLIIFNSLYFNYEKINKTLSFTMNYENQKMP